MNNEAGEVKGIPDSCRANVRFTPAEYRRLQRDQLLTGQSIPWLLKTRYFSGELKPPAFDYETSREILRQLSGIGTNLNQIARRVNSGISDGVHEQISAMLKLLEHLNKLAMRDYGDR